VENEVDVAPHVAKYPLLGEQRVRGVARAVAKLAEACSFGSEKKISFELIREALRDPSCLSTDYKRIALLKYELRQKTASDEKTQEETKDDDHNSKSNSNL